MKTLYAEFTAKPGCADQVAELLRGLTANVRTEPGNVVFDGYQVAGEPHRFFVFEVYRDEDAFRAHIAMPYGKPFNEALSDLIEEPHSLLIFLDPVG